MNITRRDAIKNCFIITAGAVLVPSCMQESKPTIALKHLEITGKQEKLITELCETIIPATDTPGAKDTYTHLFVLKMLDDCYPRNEQDQFISGMKEFDRFSEKKFDKPFTECTVQQREQLISSMTGDKEASKDMVAFYSIIKKLTITGYLTSKYYLTNVQVYKLVPGRFYGCIPVTSINDKDRTI